MNAHHDTESQTAYEPVVLVRLRGPEGLAPLLDVRATTLRVTNGGSEPLEFVLDDLPGSAQALAARLAAEPWCAGAQAYPAIATGAPRSVSNGGGGLLQTAVRTVDVLDPALGPLRYLLLGSVDVDGPAR